MDDNPYAPPQTPTPPVRVRPSDPFDWTRLCSAQTLAAIITWLSFGLSAYPPSRLSPLMFFVLTVLVIVSLAFLILGPTAAYLHAKLSNQSAWHRYGVLVSALPLSLFHALGLLMLAFAIYS
jgi:hypothetical protein